MALNIKNQEVERLAAEVARLTGESKTEAVRKALEERKARLPHGVKQSKRDRWTAFLQREVWPSLPADQLGRVLSQDEQDAILGYGPDGA